MSLKKKDVLVSRTRLAQMDEDDSIKKIAPGSLPRWCRKGYREELPKKLSLIDVDALPMLYTRHGERLPAGVATGLIRELSDKKGAAQAMTLFAEYVHPVALARLSDCVIAQWCAAMIRDEVTNVEKVQYSWVPRIHVHFGDLYGLERAMGEAIIPALRAERSYLYRGVYYHKGRSLGEQVLPHLCAALRDGVEPGQDLLVLMAYAKECDDFMRGLLSRVLTRDPHFKGVHHGRWWWYTMHLDQDDLKGGISIDHMAHIVDALGFDDRGRAYKVGEDTQWLGAEIFERFVGEKRADDVPEALDRVSINSFRVAVWVFTQLFAQTANALEMAAEAHTMWTCEAWESLFVDRRYFAFWAQRVLWERTAPGGEPRPFRVCEDLSFADESDEPLELHDADTIRVLESASLGESERLRWADLLASYEVITAFEQF